MYADCEYWYKEKQRGNGKKKEGKGVLERSQSKYFGFFWDLCSYDACVWPLTVSGWPPTKPEKLPSDVLFKRGYWHCFVTFCFVLFLFFSFCFLIGKNMCIIELTFSPMCPINKIKKRISIFFSQNFIKLQIYIFSYLMINQPSILI